MIGEQPKLSANGASDEIEKTSELRHLSIHTVEVKPESRIVLASDPRSPGADRFRLLRMSLRELRTSAKLQTVVITSALPQDGKSTVALNLATVLAEKGKHPVLLIEADLHCPTLSNTLGLSVAPGLAECLDDGLEPLSALRRLDPLQWFLLQAGEPRGNPTELLQSASFARILEKLSPYFEWILIDTPPLAPLSDALLLSRQADATLLVVRADRTTRVEVAKAVELLGPGRVAGIVLNGAQELNRLYSKYSGYYGKK
jgi:receptor protein-tyrosine kinase